MSTPMNLNILSAKDAIEPLATWDHLPLYPWHYEEPLSLESRLAAEWRLRQFPHHDLLGSRVLESTDQSPNWRNILRLDVGPWIREHEVAGDVVFPGVGYICMAGEAIRQLSGSAAFTCRRVSIKAALVMRQGQDTEVITHLHKAPLTTSLDSKWYNFTMLSYNNGSWIKHIAGQVSPGNDREHPPRSIQALPRALSRRSWYHKMKVMGLDYGPRFMGLTNMSAHPTERKVVATIENDICDGESCYNVHPVTMDCLMQALAPAMYYGLTRRFRQMGIPTYMEEIYVSMPVENKITIEARGDERLKDGMSGDVTAISGDQVCIEIVGLQMSNNLDMSDNQSQDPHAAVELEWREDVNLIKDVSNLIYQAKDRSEVHELLDKFSAACMLMTAAKIRDLVPTRKHISQYKNWLQSIAKDISASGYSGIKAEDKLLFQGTDFDLSRAVDSMYSVLQQTDASATATAMYRILNSCVEIFSGDTQELGLLMEDNVLHLLYDFMQNTDYNAYLGLIAHRKPNLRVLEIGAGTGGTTATVLPAPKSTYGERMYFSYTYTDVSSGFFCAAKKRFENYSAINYSVLDITKDPTEQGYEAESYDLIIACNQGRLLLQELAPKTKWINYVMGILPGWWLGEADNRYPQPYVSFERWDAELKQAGFSDCRAIYDGYLNNNIIARPGASIVTNNQRVTLLYSSLHQSRARSIGAFLEDRSYAVDLHAIEDSTKPLPKQDMLSVLDLDGPFFHDLNRSQFEDFQKLLTQLEGSDIGLLWVTAAAQISCQDPRYAMVNGLARVIRTEMSLDFATVELDDFGTNALNIMVEVLDEFEQRIQEPDVNPTTEWAVRQGRCLISRYHYIKVRDELSQNESQVSSVGKLEQRRPGLPDTLFWDEVPPHPEAVAPGEIEMQIKAVGLNFKVRIYSFGNYPLR
ncbi:hypothetical protein QQS21_000276 [Conoideocrella luteorostrata]|uniref:PKS/mFAS DH domain-containing protein n=1 Tax=Conoideocrella luteorostrata TaxID=1105319 RepID=A0AAJ0G480_9HYPO|nr:hypothetical protein QQS21_000276 [Conoideocrella luteorostrata]